jgi:hypothetical protein
LYVNGLTIANGHYDNPRAFGGGGGCISSKGNVFLNYSAVSSCYLSSSVYAAGGGILAFHTVSLYRSSVTGNTVQGNGGADALGGGIQAYEVELYRSTVSGNTASYSGAGLAVGGVSAYAVHANYSTVSENGRRPQERAFPRRTHTCSTVPSPATMQTMESSAAYMRNSGRRSSTAR